MDKIRVNGRLGYEVPCDHCGSLVFKTTSDYNRAKKKGKGLYCSQECIKAGISTTLSKCNLRSCNHCGDTYEYHRSSSKYCSKECANKALEKRQSYRCETCGTEVDRTPAQLKSKVFCSKSCADKGYSGENNPRWIKDRSLLKDQSERKTPEYKEWREAVFLRDSYTCQKCGSKGELNAHHIHPYAEYPKLRTELNNGITLCVECHKDIHKKEKVQWG